MSGASPATPPPPHLRANTTAAQAVSSPFVTERLSPLGGPSPPALAPHPNETPSPQPASRFAASSTLASAPEATGACLPMSAGPLAATGHTPAVGAPSAPLELSGAPTPLRHSHFESELTQHPDKAWVSRLLSGITHGVDIDYMGPREPMDAPNLLSARTHPHVIQVQLQNEVDAGRIRGPFTVRPLPALRCSGLGVVPKKGNKWRMILHLSAPFGSSVNDFISKESFSLQYSSVDDAVRFLVSLGPGARMAKADLKSAFRMVPVRPQDWELLGMRWQGAYYFDTCLPFGLRSAPFLFNEYAEALQWIVHHNYGVPHLLHYLDDYFIAGPPESPLCAAHLRQFLQVCDHLGIPVAMDKVDGPATTLTFLGLELDSVQQQIRVPPEKLSEILMELHDWSSRTKATKRALLSIIGKLSFAARAVPAGRLFLRRLITLSTTVQKLHHHIRLGRQAQADFAWWVDFLPTWNGTARFIDPSSIPAYDLDLYTDASGTLGCGAYFCGSWFHFPWQPHQLLSEGSSIQWQELFAILAAALTWGHLWSGKRIRFFCDNKAIVDAWQHKSAKHPAIVSLLRLLFLHAAQHDYVPTFQHLPGRENHLADALSRRQFTRFFSLAPQAAQDPTPTPGVLTTL